MRSNELMVLESRGFRGCGRTRTFAGLSLSIVNSDTGDVFSTGLDACCAVNSEIVDATVCGIVGTVSNSHLN